MKTIRLLKIRTLCLLSVFLTASLSYAAVHYVKPSEESTAWSEQTSVYTDFTTAYNAAAAGDEIWVAAGEYMVTSSLTMKSVSVYGGFAGTETAIDERAKVTEGKAWEFVNTSILKLNPSGNSLTNLFNAGSNGITFTLDGVTLDGNKSNGKVGRALQVTTSGTNYNINIIGCVVQNFKSGTNDGGAFNIRFPSVTIAECLITNNEGNKGGAGYFDNGIVIRDCDITYNSAPTGQTSYQGSTAGGGGGLFLANTGAAVTVYNCFIANNTASFGGGVFIRDKSKIYNSIIVNNNTSAKGSGICFEGRDNGGSVYNCIIANNTSALVDGSGVNFTSTNNGDKKQTLRNSILFNNKDSEDNIVNIGTVVTNGSVSPVISNNILDKEYTLGEIASVIETDPAKLFTDLNAGNYNPPIGGFAGLDKGNDEGLVFATEQDYAGVPRVQGSAIDIGVYEQVPAEQIIDLTIGEGIASTTPETITSIPTGNDLTVDFTLATGYHSPYVVLNGKKTEATEIDGIYTLTVPAITATQTIHISAFAANILPVNEDTYQRRNGSISGSYADSPYLETRGETAGYAAIPVLKFVPTADQKSTGYNKATLQLVPRETFSINYTVRQLPDTYATINDIPANDYTTLMNAPVVGTPTNGNIDLVANTPISLNVTDNYVLNPMSDEIRLSVIKGSQGTVHTFHSLENGNVDYVPQLVFSKLPVVTVDAKSGITVVTPTEAGPYLVEEGESFVITFTVSGGKTPIVRINGVNATAEQLNEVEGVYTLTLSSVTEDTAIELTQDVGTGLNTDLNNDIQVYTRGLNLIVESQEMLTLEVYSISGSLIMKQDSIGTTSISLDRGSYILKAGGKAYKVLLK